jgi:hypothetical protein
MTAHMQSAIWAIDQVGDFAQTSPAADTAGAV